MVQPWDWSGYDAATVIGLGAPETAVALLDARRTMRVSASIEPPASFDTPVVLAVQLLDELSDAAAVRLLTDVGGRAGGATVLSADLVLEDDPHDHDAELDLQLRVACGSGVRTAAEWTALFAAAGVRADTQVDVGWDVTLWQLAPIT